MAKGFKTGGNDFKPGHKQSTGAPKLPEEVKLARKLSASELILELTKHLRSDRETLKQILEVKETTMLTRIAIKLILRAAEEGHIQSVQLLLERILGKVPEKVEFEGEVAHSAKQLSKEEIVVELKNRNLPNVFEIMNE